jgi:hypothetical protein
MSVTAFIPAEEDVALTFASPQSVIFGLKSLERRILLENLKNLAV